MAAFYLRLTLVGLLLWPVLSMAGPNDRYWIGQDGNFANGANWSTSGNALCGTGTAGVPSTGHTVHFTSKCTSNAVIGASISVQAFQIEAGYTGTITQASGATITVGTGNFSQAAGKFIGGDAAITVNGSFTAGGETFTSTSATLTAATGFSVTAGSFNHNGGTVQLFTAGGQTATLNVTGSQALNHLTIGGNFGPNTLTVSTALVVNGTLNYASSSAGVPATVNSAGITATGDIVQGAAGAKGSSVLTIAGSGGQTLQGGGAAASLPPLVINKTSGTLTLSGTIATGANWTYVAGTLDPASSTVQFFTAASQTISLTGSHDLNNVTIGGAYASDTMNIGGATTLTVNGSLRFASAETMRSILNGGAIVAKGDIHQGQGGSTGTTTMTIAGSGDQTYYGVISSYNVGSSPPLIIAKPSGTLYLSGAIAVKNSWTYVSGTIDPGTSYLNIFPESGVPISISGSHTLHHITVKSSVIGTITLAAGTTLTARGIFAVETGQLVTMNGGTIEAKGNLTRSGLGASGTTNLLLSGPANQRWSGETSRYPGSVTINKPSGTVTLANPLILDSTQALNIVSGTLDQGTAAALASGPISVGANGVWRNRGSGAITLHGNVVNDGLIEIRRSACGADTIIQSSIAGTQRLWSGSGTVTMQDVYVQDQGGSLPITAYSSSAGTNVGANWTFDPGCSVAALTAPGDNAMYQAPASFQLTATPASTGPVARLEFYRNGSLIATDTSEPYTHTEAGLEAGTYSYSVLSYDSAGVVSPSNRVTVTVTDVGATSINVAQQTNGGVASASIVHQNNPALYLHGVNSGNRIATSDGQFWTSGGGYTPPVWLRIDFDGAKTIGEVDVFMWQTSPLQPTPDMQSAYTVSSFQIQHWDGADWADIPNATAVDNLYVWRRFAFAPITTTAIRVLQHASNYLSYSLIEVEAWTVDGQAPPAEEIGGFNAFEQNSAAGASAGDIRTKLAASTFKLDVVALNSDRSAVLTGFTGDVKVELVDASNNSGAFAGTCRSSWTAIAASATTLSFAGGDNGRKEVSLSTANAWRDVRVRISHPATGSATTTSCSTDNFAVRPAALTVSVSDTNSSTAGSARALNNGAAPGGVVHKAGRPFTLTAAAPASASSYAGNPTVKSLSCLLPAGCANGTLSPGAYGGTGTRSATATYSEAGTFSLELHDASFSDVDADDSSDAERTIPQDGGALTVGRFVPDHFDLAALTAPVFRTFGSTCATRAFTYLGQPFAYATVPQATLTARNADGATTLNYSGALWPASLSVSANLSYTPDAVSPTTLDVLAFTPPAVTSIGATSNRGTGTVTGNAGDRLRLARPGRRTDQGLCRKHRADLVGRGRQRGRRGGQRQRPCGDAAELSQYRF